MKHRLLLLLLFVFTAVMTGWAQNSATPSYTVKGVLLDSLTQDGEPYATIKITKKGAPDKAVKMAVTGANGRFQEKLNVGAGDYVITISSIGKAPVTKEFTLKPSVRVIDLGTMLSAEANNELKGVEVVAQKPLVKVDVDKIEYNIEDDPDSKSNSILEMLRKVPLVTVDGEDNIQVNGSSSFKIHVNGKPNNMMSNNPKEVLKSMPANSIKYIEVITSPGAKYDAEGVGGILNIVTVGGGFEGYTATFRANASNYGAGAGGYAMVKQGKMTVSANYNFNYNDRPRGYSDSYRENYESDTEKYLESNSSSKSKGNFQYGNLEGSYEIDTLRLLTVAFGMYGSNSKNYGDGFTTMYGANHEDIAYSYRTGNHGDGSWYSINGNIDYQRTSRKNKQRMITFSYKINTQPQTSNSNTGYEDIHAKEEVDDLVKRLLLKNSQSDGKTNTMEQTFQVDYTTPIGELHTVEAGAKYIFRRNTSDNKLYEAAGGSDDYLYNEDRSSDYRHLNHILAAYLGYTLKYKDFTFKPGVRYEQTVQRVKYIVGPGENFHTNFSDLVPSVSLGMKLGKTQNMRVGYNMRIWRPGIWNLNPYFNNLNPMFITQGNSNLKSEKSHAFDLSYSNFSAKFNINVSLRHSFNNNSIENISRLITAPEGEMFDNDPTHIAPEGALYSTYANIGKSRNTGMSLYLNWNASPKTRLYVNGRGNYSDLKSEAQGLHNYGWNGSFYGNSNLKSEKSHAFDLSYSNFSAKFNINVSLRHSFNNNSIENISRLITAPEGEMFDNDPTHIAPEGALYSTYANIGKSRNTGMSLYLNWNASPKTRLYVNGRGNYSDLKSEAQGLHNYGWNGSFYGGVQHTLPLKIRLSLNGGGSTPYINLQGKGSGYYYYSLGASRSFLKDERLSLNVYCSNIFEKYRSYNNHTEGVNFLSKSSSKWPSRSFGVSISYRIGELKASVKKAARSINNDDVKGGGGEGGNTGGGGGQ